MATVAWLWLSMGCSDPDAVDIRAVGHLDYEGRIERIETLGRYTALDTTLLFQLIPVSGRIAVENDYFLYRVAYPTENVRGGQTTVSALIAIPSDRNIKGIVSWHHGTQTNRKFSISIPSAEGLGIAGLFAGDGYILVAADYIGLGLNHETHPYYHWPSTVTTLIDLLSIAEIMLDGIAANPDRDLYLSGFSQGGGATLALQKALETNHPTGLQLRAAAPISGAFDPAGVSLRRAIQGDDPFNPEYLVLHMAYLSAAFAEVYGESLSGVVQEAYADRLHEWFDGTHDSEFLKRHLPHHLEDFLTGEFLQGLKNGEMEPTWFRDALAATVTSDYVPRATLRMFFGKGDRIVSPEESPTAYEKMRALGGNVELVDLGEIDHEESVLRALPNVQNWFDGIEASKP